MVNGLILMHAYGRYRRHEEAGVHLSDNDRHAGATNEYIIQLVAAARSRLE